MQWSDELTIDERLEALTLSLKLTARDSEAHKEETRKRIEALHALILEFAEQVALFREQTAAWMLDNESCKRNTEAWKRENEGWKRENETWKRANEAWKGRPRQELEPSKVVNDLLQPPWCWHFSGCLLNDESQQRQALPMTKPKIPWFKTVSRLPDVLVYKITSVE